MKTSNYYKPTPKLWRKLGDSLLVVALFLSTGALFQYDLLKEIYTPKEVRTAISVIITIGIIGKFLTNFFKEDEKTV
jgi:uncharacterized PurR-regulated membrane protein YhhQ (DUF165 family)